jgi:HK97 family phage portal protein
MRFGPDQLALEMGVRMYGADHTKAASLSPVDDRGWSIVREWTTGSWQADDATTVDSQLTYYAVYACVTLIANDIGKLRPRLVEKSGNIWRETTSPAFSPILRNPNRYQNHIQFKEWWAMSKLTRGNAYALKQRDGRGVVTALYMLDPCRVTPLVAEDGAVFYQLNQDHLSGLDEAQVIVPAREIIHDRMNCLFHPLVGISPLYAAGLAARQGLAIQSQSRAFFGNGARPSGILTAPGNIPQETADRLKEVWETKFTGTNAGKVAILGDGLKYEPMIMTSADAQMIEQLKMTAEMVCATFHVPAFKVGIGTMPTYQNGEMLNQIYYSDCLQSMIEQFELCMDGGLGIGEGIKTAEGRELGVELDLRGLLRMDTATQVKTLGDAVKGSLLSINGAREEMDLPPVSGGDTIWMQQQNYSLEALQERDRNDPFAKPEPAPEPPNPEPEPDIETAKALVRTGFYRKVA